MGPGLLVDRHVLLRHPPGRGWRLGRDVYLGHGAVLDVWPGAELELGDRTKVMHYAVIGARESVRIGHDSQISEHSSVRDADHGTAADVLVREAPMTTEPVTIGADCWIGKGAAVLRGAHLADGVVLGANSVVRGHLPRGAVAVGAPARVVRLRE
ncbi:MAG: acyltransferase [Mycobacteriales bacterium]